MTLPATAPTGDLPVPPAEPRPRICAVIVSRDPDGTIVESIRRLGREVARVVVVDNGSGPAGRAVLEGSRREAPDLEIVWNPENRGIAEALNQGVTAARRCGAEWILTLDHDSLIGDGYIAAMLRAYELSRRREPGRKVGMIVPRYVFKDKPAAAAGTAPASEYRWLREAITSGDLVRASLYGEAGPYRSELFVDYVDFEFCLRLRRLGFRLLEAAGATLHHAMGNVLTTTFLGIPIVYTTYAPARRYYKTRNRVWCWKTYGCRCPLWAARDLGQFLRDLAKIVITERTPGPHLRAVVRGLADGLLSRMGRREF